MTPPNTFPTRRNRHEGEERKSAVDQGPPRRVGRAGGLLGLNCKHVSIAGIRENAPIEFGVGSELGICWAKGWRKFIQLDTVPAAKSGIAVMQDRPIPRGRRISPAYEPPDSEVQSRRPLRGCPLTRLMSSRSQRQ